MTCFNRTPLNETQMAQNFLQYLNDEPATNLKNHRINQKIARLKFTCIIISLGSMFWFPQAIIEWRSAWLLMIVIIFAFLIMEEIELKTTQQIMKTSKNFIDKQKLENVINSSNEKFF